MIPGFIIRYRHARLSWTLLGLTSKRFEYFEIESPSSLMNNFNSEYNEIKGKGESSDAYNSYILSK